MINLAAVERDHLLTAIEQFDAAGGEALLAEQPAEASGVVVHHHGRTYDGVIIAGLAHGLATGYTPEPDRLRSRKAQLAKAVERGGFDVYVADATKHRPRTSGRRSDQARTQAPAARVVRAPAICPMCFVALPATGECDTCGP